MNQDPIEFEALVAAAKPASPGPRPRSRMDCATFVVEAVVLVAVASYFVLSTLALLA